jgi:hypothetical protein
MPFEVDVQPVASRLSRLVDRHGYEGRADALVTCLLGDHRVLQPGVNQAVPKDVHKADQAVPVPSDDPPQAVPVDLIDPVPLGLVENARFECFSVKLVQFHVLERAPPLVCDCHVVILVAFSGLFRRGSAVPRRARCQWTIAHPLSLEVSSRGQVERASRFADEAWITRLSDESLLSVGAVSSAPHREGGSLHVNNLRGNALSVAALQVEGARVDAVPLSGGLGAVVEDVPQVRAARHARHLDPVHEEAGVVVELHGVG